MQHDGKGGLTYLATRYCMRVSTRFWKRVTTRKNNPLDTARAGPCHKCRGARSQVCQLVPRRLKARQGHGLAPRDHTSLDTHLHPFVRPSAEEAILGVLDNMRACGSSGSSGGQLLSGQCEFRAGHDFGPCGTRDLPTSAGDNRITAATPSRTGHFQDVTPWLSGPLPASFTTTTVSGD